MVEVTIKPSLMSQLYNITKYRVIFETQKKNGLPLQLFHSTGLPVRISLKSNHDKRCFCAKCFYKVASYKTNIYKIVTNKYSKKIY